MPHYQNGTEAKLGDLVVGRTYNRKTACVGVVVSITPGQDTCNCQIERLLQLCDRATMPDSGADYGELRAFLPVQAPEEPDEQA